MLLGERGDRVDDAAQLVRVRLGLRADPRALALEGERQLAVVDARRDALALAEPRPQRVAVGAGSRGGSSARCAACRRGSRAARPGTSRGTPRCRRACARTRRARPRCRPPARRRRCSPGRSPATSAPKRRSISASAGGPAAVLDDVVQQRGDRLVLVAVHLEHQRRDREQVRRVRDLRALAQLPVVVAQRDVQRLVEAGGQQRACRCSSRPRHARRSTTRRTPSAMRAQLVTESQSTCSGRSLGTW